MALKAFLSHDSLTILFWGIGRALYLFFKFFKERQRDKEKQWESKSGGGGGEGQGRERERECFHPLIHSLNAKEVQGWPRLKLGARTPIQGVIGSHRLQEPSYGVIITASQGLQQHQAGVGGQRQTWKPVFYYESQASLLASQRLGQLWGQCFKNLVSQVTNAGTHRDIHGIQRG